MEIVTIYAPLLRGEKRTVKLDFFPDAIGVEGCTGTANEAASALLVRSENLSQQLKELHHRNRICGLTS
jgi:hypothetical protein